MQEPPQQKMKLVQSFPPCFFTCFQQDIVICGVFFKFRFKSGGEKTLPVFEVPGKLPVVKRLHSWKAVGNAKPTNQKVEKTLGVLKTPRNQTWNAHVGRSPPRNRRPVLRGKPTLAVPLIRPAIRGLSFPTSWPLEEWWLGSSSPFGVSCLQELMLVLGRVHCIDLMRWDEAHSSWYTKSF